MFEMPEAATESKNQPDESTRFEFCKMLDGRIISRLALLEDESEFNKDSRKIECGMDNVLDFLEQRYADQYPQLHLSRKQRNDARMAAILHDIGKSGPVRATSKEQKIIVKIFAHENIRDPKLLVDDVAKEIFDAHQLKEILESLEKCGIGRRTTMREFWDMHAQWTHDILEKYPQGLNRHIQIIAASHHIDHGINPYELRDEEIPPVANIIGSLEDYVEALEQRVLIALDQYEASIRRSESSHEVAISWVRKNLAHSEKFKEDSLMKMVLDAIDELGREQRIFTQAEPRENN